MSKSLMSFDEAMVLYEPYPIAYFTNFLDSNLYGSMIKEWPEFALFKAMPDLGKKYSLSERNNPHHYLYHIRQSKPWLEFYSFIKSDGFIESVIAYLASINVDLCVGKRKIVSKNQKKHSSIISRIKRITELSARFEFSLMDSNGGSILPHTDAGDKIITLVISAVENGEWDHSWGGGTQICLPKERSKIYNQRNNYLQFEDVDTIKEFPFVANQCICFIKTYNSWHQVTPLRGPAGGPLRKTITINIEKIN
jgi:hypothetical protein